MVSKERATLLWEEWVMGLDPARFMDWAQTWALNTGAWWTTPRKAVRWYLDRLDNIFGPGSSEQAPEDLEEALVQHIKDKLGVEEDSPWQVTA